jgi:hypothetical protein
MIYDMSWVWVLAIAGLLGVLVLVLAGEAPIYYLARLGL